MPPNSFPRQSLAPEGHPLLMPEVLHRLVDACFLEQLKVFRLVCRAWRDASFPRFRQHTTLNVNFSDTTTGINVSKLLEDQQNPVDPLHLAPVQNISFVEPYATITSELDLSYTFWKTCGNQLKSFIITENIPAVHVNSFVDTVLKCPNLENLDFSIGVSEVNDSDVVFIPSNSYHDKMTAVKVSLNDFNGLKPYFTGLFHWKNLLSRFPQLKALTLDHNQFGDMVQVLSDILDAIESLQKETPEVLMLHYLNLGDTFKKVVIPTEVHKDLIKKLCKLSFQLKTFIVSHAWPKTIIIFARVLQTHKDTLEDFRTCLTASSEEFQARGYAHSFFPPGLKHLEFPFKSLNFLKFTPNLTSVVISVEDLDQEICEKVDKFDVKDRRVKRMQFSVGINGKENFLLVHLTRFYLSEYYRISSIDLQKFTEWSPNLRYLAMNLNNKAFSIVCQGWKDLRFLAILMCEVDTEGFSGIVENTPRLPNITDLKYLQTVLVIDLKAKIGNVAFTEGFIKLEFLYELKIFDSGENVVCDADTLKSLHDKVPVCEVWI